MAKCLVCGKFVFTWFHAVEACPTCGTPLRDEARTARRPRRRLGRRP
jgi:hypothetical protein